MFSEYSVSQKPVINLVPSHASPWDNAVKNCSTSFGTPREDLFAIHARQRHLRGHQVALRGTSDGLCWWLLNLTVTWQLFTMRVLCQSPWIVFFPPARKNHTHHTECKILQSVSEQYILSSLHAPACMAFCPPCPKAVKDLASVQPVPSGSHLVRLIAHCVPAK